MATVKEYFYNVKCDHCGAILDDEYWVNEPYEPRLCDSYEGWRMLGKKDYCPNCWHYDDNDNIVTADGKVWDEDTEEEIKEE